MVCQQSSRPRSLSMKLGLEFQEIYKPSNIAWYHTIYRSAVLALSRLCRSDKFRLCHVCFVSGRPQNRPRFRMRYPFVSCNCHNGTQDGISDHRRPELKPARSNMWLFFARLSPSCIAHDLHHNWQWRLLVIFIIDFFKIVQDYDVSVCDFTCLESLVTIPPKGDVS